MASKFSSICFAMTEYSSLWKTQAPFKSRQLKHSHSAVADHGKGAFDDVLVTKFMSAKARSVSPRAGLEYHLDGNCSVGELRPQSCS
jgi:hypothetical protein